MTLDRAIVPDPYDFLPPRPTFTLTSPHLEDGARMPLPHVHGSAGGDDVSPALAWTRFPEQTRGFTITCFDPDAPTACGFWHWVAVDLPASARGPATRACPAGSTSATTSAIARTEGRHRPRATTPTGTSSWCTRWTPIGSDPAPTPARCTSGSTSRSTRWRGRG
jgi:hypothetical protein